MVKTKPFTAFHIIATVLQYTATKNTHAAAFKYIVATDLNNAMSMLYYIIRMKRKLD